MTDVVGGIDFTDLHRSVDAACEEMDKLREQRDDLLAALKRARTFIRNGIEYGYIRMPDPDVRDSAHDTPDIIDAAIKKAEGHD